ncbi:MAG TPA: glycerophosphodiester phosphodiesterase family protein [Anaeromyxobacteraceae bacterium]|nr:glycerophosphodiester phosphodiesterase family protein [Anaeromyxobacteraceae bacterium]
MSRKSSGGPSRGRPIVLAHRGASAEAPENTLAAFVRAMEQGADGVELDVWRCGTGEVVVHHDPDTTRTAGMPVRIMRASLRELRRLDVGSRTAERYRGERIPLLAEVLDALPGATVNVELKSSGLPDPALAREVSRLVQEARAVDRCIVSSFDLAVLALFRLVAPSIATGVLFARGQRHQLREFIGKRVLRPRAVHPELTLVTEERVRAWSASGLEVNVWTADAPEEVERLCRLGVSAIITNRPAVARAAVSRLAPAGPRR